MTLTTTRRAEAAQAAPSAPATPPAVRRTPHDLTEAEVEQIGQEMDAIRRSVMETRGAADAAYIRRVIAAERHLRMGSRVVLLLSGRSRTAWVLGTAGLTLAKILDNMEIGHNVLHGQWDWMRDPTIHSSTWEWDFASPAAQWKRAHNELHHVHTNVLGKDNDLGYGIMRVDEGQAWEPRHLFQPALNFVNACVFEYGIAAYDLDLGDTLRNGRTPTPEMKREIRTTVRKAGAAALRDYVALPLLSVGSSRQVFTATLTASLLRNLWSHSVIMCGHFPEGVETFEVEQVDPDETRGAWYLRQMLGSANISGGPVLHLLAGNLSHQVEHHLFPDMPSNRYAEVAPRVRAVFERHGLTYNSRPLPQQVFSAWHRIVRLSLPDGGWRALRRSRRPAQTPGISPVSGPVS
jgi:fatty acid desaturase